MCLGPSVGEQPPPLAPPWEGGPGSSPNSTEPGPSPSTAKDIITNNSTTTNNTPSAPAAGPTPASSTAKLVGLLATRGLAVLQVLDLGKPRVTIMLARRATPPTPPPRRHHHRRHHHSSTDDNNARHDAPTLFIVKDIECTSACERAEALSEVAVLEAASEPRPSPYVVPILHAMGDDRHVCIVMPFIEGGDLCELITERDRGLPEDEARLYFRHMLEGLLHLKQRNIAHGDVSLENVVLSSAPLPPPSTPTLPPITTPPPRPPSSSSSLEEPHSAAASASAPAAAVPVKRACLIDLGSASVTDPTHGHTTIPAHRYHYKGKLGYIPPELLYGVMGGGEGDTSTSNTDSAAQDVDPFAVDVWSLGVCLYPMLTGRRLYASPDDSAFTWLARGQVEDLLSRYSELGVGLPTQQAKDLVCAMLRPDPSERPTLEEVLHHAWLAEPDGDTIGAGI